MSSPPQSNPNFTAGGTLFGRTAAQWNAYFAAKGAPVAVSDGTNTIENIAQVTFDGATVSGESPNATVTMSGGSAFNPWQPGVPDLSAFTKLNIGSGVGQLNVTFNENPGVAIVMTMVSNDYGVGGGLTMAVPTPPYAVFVNASFSAEYRGEGGAGWLFGWYDPDSSQAFVMEMGLEMGSLQDIDTILVSNYPTAPGYNDSGGAFMPYGVNAQWYYVANDGGGTIEFGVSPDGATRIPTSTYDMSYFDPPFDPSHVLVDIGGMSTGGTVSLFVYDPNGNSRTPGPPAWKWTSP